MHMEGSYDLGLMVLMLQTSMSLHSGGQNSSTLRNKDLTLYQVQSNTVKTYGYEDHNKGNQSVRAPKMQSRKNNEYGTKQIFLKSTQSHIQNCDG